MEFAGRKGSARRKVSRLRVRADIFNYSGHITKNKMGRPSLTGDCAWQASFPAEEQPYSSDLFSRRDTLPLPSPPPQPLLSLSLSLSLSLFTLLFVALGLRRSRRRPATPAFVLLRLLASLPLSSLFHGESN